MSQQEFENYLALLTRLLRIGPRERDRVAEEFRTHMEDRLDDLLSRGMSRDKAVQIALEEFGDAAAMAAELVSISRNKRRRWIMRITTASVAAIVLIAAGIVTFWPGGNAGPGRAALVAQDPNQSAGKADPFEGQPAKVNAGADLTLAERLNARTEAEFVETPLRDVMSFLGSKHGLQIIFKQKRLEDVGIGLDIPITLQLRNIRLSTLLDVMLEDLNLVYTEKDDLVVITTPDDAQATMEVRVYDCRDLLTMPTVSLPRPGIIPVDPYGPGEFGEPGASSRGFTPAPPTREPGYPRSLPRTDDAPEAPATDPFAPPRNPLSPEEPSAPRRPRNEILPQAAPGGGLGGVSGPPGMMGGMVGGAGHGGPQPLRPMTAEELKAEQLLRIITTAVNPDTWQEMGGPGTIGEYNGLVVVSQSARTHSKIEKVLDMLREAANLPKSKGPRVVR